jgi:hypothetical protein
VNTKLDILCVYKTSFESLMIREPREQNDLKECRSAVSTTPVSTTRDSIAGTSPHLFSQVLNCSESNNRLTVSIPIQEEKHLELK